MFTNRGGAYLGLPSLSIRVRFSSYFSPRSSSELLFRRNRNSPLRAARRFHGAFLRLRRVGPVILQLEQSGVGRPGWGEVSAN